VVAICALTVILIGALLAHDKVPTRLDNAFWSLLPYPWGPAGQHGVGHLFLTAVGQIRQLGGPLAITLATALLCYCCLALRRYRAAILIAGGEIGASVLTRVMKPVVGRTIGGSLSYPSGHTTAAFALGTAVVLMIASSRDTRMPRSMRIVLSVITLATASLVALGMVAWRQHYLTDTFGGAAVGIGVPLTAALVIDFLADRRRRRETAPAPAAAAEPAPQLR
jgi:membrane-associated phospholipid phosphatase